MAVRRPLANAQIYLFGRTIFQKSISNKGSCRHHRDTREGETGHLESAKRQVGNLLLINFAL